MCSDFDEFLLGLLTQCWYTLQIFWWTLAFSRRYLTIVCHLHLLLSIVFIRQSLVINHLRTRVSYHRPKVFPYKGSYKHDSQVLPLRWYDLRISALSPECSFHSLSVLVKTASTQHRRKQIINPRIMFSPHAIIRLKRFSVGPKCARRCCCCSNIADDFVNTITASALYRTMREKNKSLYTNNSYS